MTTTLTVAYGDGTGPEATEAALYVLREAGTLLKIETVELGERIYHMNGWEGILPSSWEVLKRNGLLLKAPTVAPLGDTFTDVSQALLLTFEMEHLEPVRHYRGLKDGQIVIQETADAIPLAMAQSFIGESFTLFETPGHAEEDVAAKGKSNPSSMLLAALLALSHIGQEVLADKIETAWRKTIMDELYTADLKKLMGRGKKLKTMEFAEAIVERL